MLIRRCAHTHTHTHIFSELVHLCSYSFNDLLFPSVMNTIIFREIIYDERYMAHGTIIEYRDFENIEYRELNHLK